MDENVSRETALRLLDACSAHDIKNILEDEKLDYWFSNAQNWRPYGKRDKNWDTVGNQQSNPVGALAELITNGIDAILLRKARENGIANPRSPDAPQSMVDAVKKFFPHVIEGKIANLSGKQRTELAEQCLLVGIKRADRVNSRYPTYTIVDFGEGQKPEDFPDTFLSLSEKNKEGIPFVQGKFNMGSTGSLRFCTRSNILLGHYKLIISKRLGEKYWGWSLIRVRSVKAGEQLPVVEYFSPGGQIPRFREDALSAFGHKSIGHVPSGTIVKLYEFDVGKNAYQVDLGLRDALDVNLIDCALPIRIYDFDAKLQTNKGLLRAEGIAASTFSGISASAGLIPQDGGEEEAGGVTPEASEGAKIHHVLEDNHEQLGRIKILAITISHMKESLRDRQNSRVFYTVNGQTQAVERASFLNIRVGLGDLRNHLLVNVVCDNMDKTALASIFMPDRERKASNDLSRTLEDLVIDALKGDPKLRAFANEIKLNRAKKYADEKEDSEDLLKDLVKADPAIKELFGLGVLLPEIAKVPSGMKPFVGKKFPTFLNPLNLKKEDDHFVKEIPIHGYRRIECGTDAENEYLSRIDSPGNPWCSLSDGQLPWSVKLWNGTASFSVKAPQNASVGQVMQAEFGFMDEGKNFEPLKFSVRIKFVEEEKPFVSPAGKKTDTKDNEKKSIGMPYFEWVNQDQWSEHSFDADSGAYVLTSEETCVYINRNNRYLEMMRVSEKDDAARTVKEAMFKLGLGIFALSIHRKASDKAKDESSNMEAEDIVRLSTSAMAAHVITVIRHLGGSEVR